MWRVDPQPDVISPAAEAQIDRVCDQFEVELKAGHRPDLASFVDQVPRTLRERLLVELILVGLEYTGTAPVRKSDTTRPPVALTKPLRAPATAPEVALQDLALVPPAPDPPPQTIGGYELLNELGRGGMGVVYRARQVEVDRIVALKIIQCGKLDNSRDETRRAVLLERFKTEVIAASRLDHESIATVYEVGQFGEAPYYSMRLVEGESLGTRVQAGPLDCRQAARYVLQIARTMAKLHAIGVIHRDLKPSNILIDETTDTPVLTDFGLAKLVDGERNVTLTDEGFGSPPYMAPEQVLHATSVTSAADIYSLGATLYHLVTGQAPFQADAIAEVARQIVFCEPVGPRQIDESIPRDLETICLKCLEKDEVRRYASAADLADDLQRYLEGRPILARRTSSLGRLWRWSRRNPAWTLLSLSLLGLACVSAVVVTAMSVRHERAAAENRQATSNRLLAKSGFPKGGTPFESLPWLIGCLELDAGTPQEAATRERIYSVLHHGPRLLRLFCHDGPILCGAFSDRGDRLVTGSADRTARVWSTASGKCEQTLQHKARVRKVVFNHAGDLVATATDDGEVRIWSLATGQEAASPLAHAGYVSFVEFTADDEYLVTATADESVRLWRAKDGSLFKTIAVARAGLPASPVALSPDGTRMVAGSAAAGIGVWPLHDVAPSRLNLEHPGGVLAAAFSPDGTRIASAAADGTVRIWEASSGRMLHELAHPSGVKKVRFSADLSTVVTATDAAAYVWSTDGDQPVARKFTHRGITAFDPCGNTLLTCGNDRTVKLWNPQADGSSIASLPHAGDAVGAACSDDGRRILTFASDGVARLWSPGDRHLSIEGIADVRIAQSAPGRDAILAWSTEGTGTVLEPSTLGARRPALSLGTDTAAACISPNGMLVAAASASGQVRVWDRLTSKVVAEFPGSPHPIRGLEFAPDNRTLAMTTANREVVLCNALTGVSMRSFPDSGEVTSVAFNSQGEYLLVAGSALVRLHRLDGTELASSRVLEFGGEIRGAQFSPDGRFVVVYGTASHVAIWDVVAGSRVFLPSDSPVNAVTFTENSSSVLTMAHNGTARLWRLIDGSPVSEPMTYHAPLKLGAISPDGQLVALCGADGTARVWQLQDALPVTIRLHHASQIVHVQFVDSGQLVTVTAGGELHRVHIATADASIDELRALAKVYSGRTLVAGRLVEVPDDELTRRTREHAASSPR